MLKHLTLNLKHKFAFNFFKKILQQPKETSYQQTMKEAQNLGSLVKDIKFKNSTKSRILPPKTDNKLTIVTELDQTLCYSFTPGEDGYLLAPLRKYDHYEQFPQYNAYLSLYKRKGLDKFLDYINKNCEVIVWTTGVKSYADILMQCIDPNNQIKYRFHQEDCDRIIYQSQQIDEYIKDLGLLGRDMKRVVYFDSHPFSYWMYPENSLPSIDFKADNTNKDQDLSIVIQQLQKMKDMPDVRTYLDDTYLLKNILQDSKLM